MSLTAKVHVILDHPSYMYNFSVVFFLKFNMDAMKTYTIKQGFCLIFQLNDKKTFVRTLCAHRENAVCAPLAQRVRAVSAP